MLSTSVEQLCSTAAMCCLLLLPDCYLFTARAAKICRCCHASRLCKQVCACSKPEIQTAHSISGLCQHSTQHSAAFASKWGCMPQPSRWKPQLCSRVKHLHPAISALTHSPPAEAALSNCLGGASMQGRQLLQAGAVQPRDPAAQAAGLAQVQALLLGNQREPALR